MKINFIIEFPLPFTHTLSISFIEIPFREDMSAIWFDYAAHKIDLV